MGSERPLAKIHSTGKLFVLFFIATIFSRIFAAKVDSSLTKSGWACNKKLAESLKLTLVCLARSEPARSIMKSFPYLILARCLRSLEEGRIVCLTITLSSAWLRDEVSLAAVGSTVRATFPLWRSFMTCKITLFFPPSFFTLRLDRIEHNCNDWNKKRAPSHWPPR